MAGTIIDQWFAAASVGEDYKTMHVWDGDGNAARVFEINFQGGYINQADVKAFMVNNTTQVRTDLAVKFTGTNTVTLSQAVPTTHKVTIYRDTNKTAPLASFADGAIITALNLDRNAKQAVFAVAEMVDRFDSVTAQAEDAIATAYSALEKAESAIVTADAASQVADAATSAAAGAVSDAKGAVQTANAATDTANEAKATADGINAKAETAMADAAAAVVTADDAKATAEGIDAKAETAMSDASKAKTDAATALSTANGINDKADKALADSASALTKAQTALDSVSGATANFDKLWKAVDSVNADNSVNWKSSQTAPYFGIKNKDGVTTYAIKDVNGSLQLDYNASSAKYFNMLGIAVQANRFRAVGGSVAAVTGDNAREANFSFTNDASRVDWNYTGGVQAMNFNGLYLTTVGGYHAAGNQNSNKSKQGMHLVWNEEGDGRGSIVVNRGGGTGGLNMRFVDAANSVETGSVRIDGAANMVLSNSLTAFDVYARGTVYAGGGGNGRLAADGNVYGTRWGGWAFDWIIANCMSDMGRGGQQFRPGAMQTAWECPAGCFLTGTNTNYNDGRILGSYFRQLIGRKVNGGQFGIGDF